jgi:signal transduction histidine kinase
LNIIIKKGEKMLLRKILFVMCFVVMSNNAIASENATEADAIAMVDKVIAMIEEKGESALDVVNLGGDDIYDKEKGLYAFVYNQDCVMLAHPYKTELVGRSYRGKPDVKGKNFRDEIVDNAIANGTAWTSYSYQKPGDEAIHHKKTYSKYVEKDGIKYVVAAGIFAD